MNYISCNVHIRGMILWCYFHTPLWYDLDFVWQIGVGVGLLASMAELVGPRLYSCCNCRTHVALHDDVISKSFQVKNLTLVLLPLSYSFQMPVKLVWSVYQWRHRLLIHDRTSWKIVLCNDIYSLTGYYDMVGNRNEI